MQGKNRKDSKGRVLKEGESERKDGRYQYRYTWNGKRKIEYASTLKELREKEKYIRSQLDSGIDMEVMSITLNEMFDKYMQFKKKLRAGTRVYYFTLWNSRVRESVLGKKKIADIRKIDVLDFYGKLYDSGLTNGTIKCIHDNLISPVLKLAVESDIIRKNPSEGCAADFGGNTKKREALTIRQQETYLDFIKNNGVYRGRYPFVVFMIETGCRISEAAGLSWSKDIDLKQRKINIDHQIKYLSINGKMQFSVEPPKTKESIRTIPLSDAAIDALVEEKKKCMQRGRFCKVDIKGYNDLLFVTGDGNPLNGTGVNAFLKNSINAYNKMEIEKARTERREPELLPVITSHILRHTACTRMVERGIAPDVVQKIMGHASIAVTMGIYNHVDAIRIEREFHEKTGVRLVSNGSKQ